MLLLAVGHAVSAELHIGSWPDYLPDTLIKKFQAETGIKTTLDTYASDAALTQKLQSGGGGYDVVIAGDYYVPVLVKSGLLQKLDKNKLPNIANIKPEYRHPSFDPQRDYAMPYTVVLTGFAYDSARVSGGNSTRVEVVLRSASAVARTDRRPGCRRGAVYGRELVSGTG